LAKIRIRHKGSLSKYGFNLHSPEKEQMKAIHEADKHYGKGEVDRKLAALEAFNKHRPRERKRIRRLIQSNRRSRNGNRSH
jgi:hypothetical protein